MSRYEWQLRMLEFAVDYVKIGAADATGMNVDQHLMRARLRHCQPLVESKRVMNSIKDHGMHNEALVKIHRCYLGSQLTFRTNVSIGTVQMTQERRA